MSSPEPLLLKFAKTIYESPLILLLCGSSAVSAAIGNIDDAVSISVSILIVLTGMEVPESRLRYVAHFPSFFFSLFPVRNRSGLRSRTEVREES